MRCRAVRLSTAHAAVGHAARTHRECLKRAARSLTSRNDHRRDHGSDNRAGMAADGDPARPAAGDRGVKRRHDYAKSPRSGTIGQAQAIQAVLSTEDRRFYDHFGVDPLGILRAAHANRIAGGIVEGGSTITQQLVKLEYRDNQRTYTRKLREALLAIWLETHLSKDEILTRYLNRVYIGDGAYGMAAAARVYPAFAR